MSAQAANQSGTKATDRSLEVVLPRLRDALQAPLDSPPIAETSHSTVYQTFSGKFGGHVAVKIINTRSLPPNIVEKFLPREIEITSKVRHPHLSRCLSVMTLSSCQTVIVSELYTRGRLLDVVLRENKIKEIPQGARYFRQLIEAVQYMHERNMVHRDIKLENILLDSSGDVKLIDFGFARFIGKRERSRSFCGTRPYSSPQMVSFTPYDPMAADWYACGIVLYTMLVGKWPQPPPPSLPRPTLSFPEDVPSMPCRRLIAALLEEDEPLRAGYHCCIHSEWMAHEPFWVFADKNFVYQQLPRNVIYS